MTVLVIKLNQSWLAQNQSMAQRFCNFRTPRKLHKREVGLLPRSTAYKRVEEIIQRLCGKMVSLGGCFYVRKVW